tara:strand:+ start:2747 stop:3127 length:381 start_codon:yes stop_codon:yes gene_type:complete
MKLWGGPYRGPDGAIIGWNRHLTGQGLRPTRTAGVFWHTYDNLPTARWGSLLSSNSLWLEPPSHRAIAAITIDRHNNVPPLAAFGLEVSASEPIVPVGDLFPAVSLGFTLQLVHATCPRIGVFAFH